MIKYTTLAFGFYLSSLFLIIFRKLVPFDYLFASITLGYLLLIVWKKFNDRSFSLVLLNVFFIFLSVIREIDSELIVTGTFSIFIYPLIFTVTSLDVNKKLEYLFKGFIILFIFSTFIQFFYSKNLFGLLELTHYTSLGSRVTPRAVSIFAGSPQSTAFIAGTLLLFTLDSNFIKLNLFYKLLLFFTGILTFSKIFIFFLLALILVRLSRKIILQSFAISIVSGLSLPLIVSIFNFEGINRLLDIIDTISNYRNYVTFEIWMSQVKLNFSSVYDLLFGKGLGILSRSNNNIFSILGHYSSESYILQVYNEIGLLGITVLIVTLLLNIQSHQRKKILALFFISIFNPSLYGITISFLIFGMILPHTNMSCLSKFDYEQ